MYADLEHIASVVRIFEDNTEFGEPFVWSCSIRWLSKTKVELMGLRDAPPLEIFRAMIRKAKELGIEEIVYSRRGKMRTFRIRNNNESY